jgi:hypothetical protein
MRPEYANSCNKEFHRIPQNIDRTISSVLLGKQAIAKTKRETKLESIHFGNKNRPLLGNEKTTTL